MLERHLFVYQLVQAVVVMTVLYLFGTALRWSPAAALLMSALGYAFLLLFFQLLQLPFFLLARVRGAVYMPTADDRLAIMLKLARLKRGERAVDLGSGDGRVVIALAKAGAVAHGYEINPFLVWESRQNARLAGVADRTRFHWQSFWKVDLSAYTVVMLYGIPYIMESLEKKLRRELKPGTRVISNAFPFPTWKPTQKVGEVLLYQQPDKGNHHHN